MPKRPWFRSCSLITRSRRLMPQSCHCSPPVGGLPATSTHYKGGATLHHMALSHQRYTTWASMMVYRMRAHEQWLNRSTEEAGILYDRAFQSTSRAIRHSHATLVCPRLNEAYASVGAQKRHIFSQWSALCTERHLTCLWVHWVRQITGRRWHGGRKAVTWLTKQRHLGSCN